MPRIALCTIPIDRYQDGNVGPLFCRDGSINVEAWAYLGDIDGHILRLGRNANIDQVKSAINADFSYPNHSTNVIEFSGYQLAEAYYGWNLSFDYWKYVTSQLQSIAPEAPTTDSREIRSDWRRTIGIRRFAAPRGTG